MARVSIEDCLDQLPNRFALVLVASNRARQLMGNSQPLIKTKNREAVTALREIAEGKVIMKGKIAAAKTERQTVDPNDFL
jgi:DNA-directed RNA polymerase subunit omega